MARRSTGLWVYRRGAGAPTPPPAAAFVVAPELRPIRYVCYVGDASGRLIGEFAGALESVAWVVDGYGMAAMILSLQAAVAVAGLLEFGNRVLIEFDNGMQPWGGVVDVPRETTRATVRVQLYEAGYLLGWRLTPAVASYMGEQARPAADILGDLVRRSGLDIEVALPAGEPGRPVEVEFGYQKLAAAAETLRGLDPLLHWHARAELANRRIRFILDTFRGYAAERAESAILIQGHNLVGGSVLEQGPIFNQILVAPGDSDLAQGGAVYVATEGGDGQRDDLRQDFVVLTDVTDAEHPGRAQAHADARLALYARPRLRTRGISLDMAPGRYRDLGIGARVQVETAAPVAYAMPLTVIGMEFDPANGTMSLVFDDGDRIVEAV